MDEIQRAQCPVCGWSVRVECGRLVSHVSPPPTTLDRTRECAGSRWEVPKT